ncbi:hypothetical protein MSG28_004571 [Choristoneura fumiferana]|uniref:Uncharacterized protein n=1 Tax=Choristoneura fumiferana TaxID=7141 RepID=A0ACC0K6D6_CHOFU|nr:hypothetical protein MSG28_004571 [Choristoneura fumiferana]
MENEQVCLLMVERSTAHKHLQHQGYCRCVGQPRGLRWDTSSASNFTGCLTLHRLNTTVQALLLAAGLASEMVGSNPGGPCTRFVLKNGTLSYWKSQSEVARKPQGQIGLGEACKISRNEGAATFEIFTGSRTYYLTADSNATMEDWIRVLQNVQRRNATKLLLSQRKTISRRSRAG